MNPILHFVLYVSLLTAVCAVCAAVTNYIIMKKLDELDTYMEIQCLKDEFRKEK